MIQAGHSWQEIQGYTLGQIKLFNEVAITLENEQRANRITEGFIAARCDQKSVEKAAKRLGGG